MRSLLTFVAEVLALAILIPTFWNSSKRHSIGPTKNRSIKTKLRFREAVVVTYRLTNLSSSLLCFPPPSIDCHSIHGELS